MNPPTGLEKTSRGEAFQALLYAIILFWINLYVARDMFSGSSHQMGSMHGFWTALAAHAGGSWFHATWWPYWSMGIPFEYTYAPLVPGLAAAIAALRGVSAAMGFQSVTGLVYIFGPLTLFIATWRLTRAPGASFAAALTYSVTAVSQLIVPDQDFAFKNLLGLRRLFVTVVWDDTPHVAALTFLPLVILFLARSIQTRKPIYYAATAASIAGCALASAFGPVMVMMTALCLLFTLQRGHWFGNLLLTIALGMWGWAIAAPFLSPSLMSAIRQANAADGWSLESFTAIGFTLLGAAILHHFLPRWTSDWRIRFFAMFAWVSSSIPICQQLLHDHFMPQPERYKFEMELALCVVAVFAIRPLWNRIPMTIRCAAAFLLLTVAASQVRDFRKAEKEFTFPVGITGTVEYRASQWARQNYPNVRIFMPGSIGQWTNAFTELPQFSGESYTMAVNPSEQNADMAILFGFGTPAQEAQATVTWLKAFGTGEVAISGKDSKEYWKAFVRPEKLEGVLPVLWREDGVTIYRVPVREVSLAHIVPESAIVRHLPKAPGDIKETESYVAGLDDASLPTTTFDWEGRNRIRIHATVASGQVLSVQETYHPGWHAAIAGRSQQVLKDGLGLMWLRPDCRGACEIVMDYDGGWELRLCRWLSWLAIAALAIVPIGSHLRRDRTTG